MRVDKIKWWSHSSSDQSGEYHSTGRYYCEIKTDFLRYVADLSPIHYWNPKYKNGDPLWSIMVRLELRDDERFPGQYIGDNKLQYFKGHDKDRAVLSIIEAFESDADRVKAALQSRFKSDRYTITELLPNGETCPKVSGWLGRHYDHREMFRLPRVIEFEGKDYAYFEESYGSGTIGRTYETGKDHPYLLQAFPHRV